VFGLIVGWHHWYDQKDGFFFTFSSSDMMSVVLIVAIGVTDWVLLYGFLLFWYQLLGSSSDETSMVETSL